jgi:hypothetical protein
MKGDACGQKTQSAHLWSSSSTAEQNFCVSLLVKVIKGKEEGIGINGYRDVASLPRKYSADYGLHTSYTRLDVS